MARLEALRKQLQAEGLFELQKQLARPALPKTIGVVTAEGGAARRDLLAGLARRGWAGTIVWAFAPVQDRRAAPAIATAIQDLAARPEVETILVTRGGGSLADLWAFCDETLCRTVAMLRVPVISAIGHERDSTLIDDVAAFACSTPTHAPEAVVPLDCGARPPRSRARDRGAAPGRRARRRRPHPSPGRPRPRPGPRPAPRAARPQPEDARDPRLLRTRDRGAAARHQRRVALVLQRAAGARRGPRRQAPARGAAPRGRRSPRPRTRAHPRARIRPRRGPRRRAADERRGRARRRGD